MTVPGGMNVFFSRPRSYRLEELARHMVPRHWRLVEEFPLTPSGKIQKFVLREQFSA